MSSIPLFFDDEIGVTRKKAVLKALPPIPDTGWLPPTTFPNLSGAKLLSFDTETKELDFDHGPGWGRNQGHIVGVSIGAEDGLGNRGKWYFPVRHECEAHLNLDPTHVFNFVRDTLERTPRIPKVGANLTYDIGWLSTENIHVAGELHDVQFAESLISEDTEVNLGHLGTKYVGIGKSGDLMYQWQSQAYGGAVNDKQRANIYRTSPRLVGFYAEADAELPLRVLRAQWSTLDSEGLLPVYRMENDLIYLMVKMRLKGINIDVAATEKLYAQLGLDILKFKKIIETQLGFELNVNSGKDIAKAFDVVGEKYPLTADGNPSFTKDFLKSVEHPLARQIIELRMYDKMRSTFVKNYLLERHTNGKIHGSFNQLRGDADGTKVGRFSGSNPNLQNIPVRPGYTEEPLLNKKHELYDPTYVSLGKRMRCLFIAEPGHVAVEKIDFSQIQYRYLVHEAVGPGADDVRAAYVADPHTDYHEIVQSLVERVSGLFIERKPIKTINFGLAFGMGADKLTRGLGVAPAVGKKIVSAYHLGAPYVKATTEHFSRMALQTGEVVSLLGRKSRFDKWEPIRNSRAKTDRQIALPHAMAINNYGTRIQRAYGHKALNRRLQMGEGDHMKIGMLRCMQDGVFDQIGVPRLTVHDELVFSVADNSPQSQAAYAHMHNTLETCITLRIPVLIDFGRGPTWGSVD